jgi:hypothetical protein
VREREGRKGGKVRSTGNMQKCNNLWSLLIRAYPAMGAHYVTLQKYFSPPSFNLFAFFPTPPMKLKLGSQIGERLLIVTHLDLLNYLAHQQQVLVFAVPFTSLSILCNKNVGLKHNLLRAKLAFFSHFFNQF